MSFTVNLEKDIAFVTLEGDFNVSELTDLFRRIRDENPNKLNFLYDIRNWYHPITIEEINFFIKSFPPRFENPRVAIVASKPVHFGLGRVVSGHAEFEGYNVLVTYEYEAALDFLRE